jgi:hypothetical protein
MKRAHAAIGAGCTVALGVLSRTVHLGFRVWDNSLGDALYAVLVYFVVAFVVPAWKPPKLGAWAFGISFLVELFQLTGLARRAPRFVRFVLGSTFSWHDVACYAVGAIAIAVAHVFVRRRK